MPLCVRQQRNRCEVQSLRLPFNFSLLLRSVVGGGREQCSQLQKENTMDLSATDEGSVSTDDQHYNHRSPEWVIVVTRKLPGVILERHNTWCMILESTQLNSLVAILNVWLAFSICWDFLLATPYLGSCVDICAHQESRRSIALLFAITTCAKCNVKRSHAVRQALSVSAGNV